MHRSKQQRNDEEAATVGRPRYRVGLLGHFLLVLVVILAGWSAVSQRASSAAAALLHIFVYSCWRSDEDSRTRRAGDESD